MNRGYPFDRAWFGNSEPGVVQKLNNPTEYGPDGQVAQNPDRRCWLIYITPYIEQDAIWRAYESYRLAGGVMYNLYSGSPIQLVQLWTTSERASATSQRLRPRKDADTRSGSDASRKRCGKSRLVRRREPFQIP